MQAPCPVCHTEGLMLARVFHAWEHRLASMSQDRVVRPFEWGLDWVPPLDAPGAAPFARLSAWVHEVRADTEVALAGNTTHESFHLRQRIRGT